MNRRFEAPRARTVVLAAICVSLASAPAARAELRADDVFEATLAQGTTPVAASSTGGGYISCAAGQRALTGGAFWHETAMGPTPSVATDTQLTASTITGDAKGWYSDGRHGNSGGNRSLTSYAFCLPKGKLKTATLESKTVELDRDRHTYGDGQATAKCPAGTRVITGGSFYHRKDQGPNAGFAELTYPSGSFATTDGKGWYANGVTNTSGKVMMTVYARCLPKARLGQVDVETFDATVPSGGTAGGYFNCPADTAALTGGAFWHLAGKGPNSKMGRGHLAAAVPTSDSLGFYSAGLNFLGANFTMTTVVHCLAV